MGGLRSGAMPGLGRARMLALVVSVSLLGGAYVSQYWGGLFPCEMCWWQRYGHMAAIPLVLLAFLTRRHRGASAMLTLVAGIALLSSGVIGLFHAGVEYGWWEGFTTCSSMPAASSGADALSQIMATPITRCDVAPWSFAGISLAGFNGVLSTGAALAIFALLRRRKAR